MEGPIPALPFVATMLVGMLVFLEIGRWIGKRHLLKDPHLMDTHRSVDGAVFALYGLLLAFTFSGAPLRLDERRRLIDAEANAISTAYMRVDLLSSDQQPQLRELFRKYLDARLNVYRKAHNLVEAESELALTRQLQAELWKATVDLTATPSGYPEGIKLLLPALNQMFEAANNRTLAMLVHPPRIIFGLLFFLALVCSLMAGYSMATSKERSWLHICAFALIAVITVFVVLEIEYPRLGIVVSMRDYDQVLVNLRQQMR